MQDDKGSFRHDSLQGVENIQDILKALGKGFAKGTLTFSDETGEIVMNPEGLLALKLTASKDGGRHKVNLRISWQGEEPKARKKSLKIR